MTNSITLIDEEAFWDCHKLKSITLPNLTKINDCTFLGCESLTSIDIPNGVTTIGVDAFADCYELSNINIPTSVTTINIFAFKNCSKLNRIKYEGTKAQWQAIKKYFSPDDTEASWDSYTGNYTVICSDGNIEK